MNTYHDAAHRIRAYFDAQGWTAADVARRAGLSWGAVSGLFDDKKPWLPTGRVFVKVEALVPDDWQVEGAD